MAAPVVLAVGVGGAGSAMVGWSAIKHLRHMRYAVADWDVDALERANIPHQIKLTRPVTIGASAPVVGEAGRKAIARALVDVDICVIVCGLGGATGSMGATAIAAAARAANVTCACIGAVPARSESPGIRHRARWAINKLAVGCDVLFLEQLERQFDGAMDGDTMFRIQDLYEHVDSIVRLACAPPPVNLILRASSHRAWTRCQLGLYRRFLLAEAGAAAVDKMAAELGLDPFILDQQFIGATDATAIVSGRERPPAAMMAQIATGLASILAPEVELDLASRLNHDCGSGTGVELVSFCPCPNALGAHAMEAGSAGWRPLMPWLDRTMPSPLGAATDRPTGLVAGSGEVGGAGSWSTSGPRRSSDRLVSFLRLHTSREPRFRQGGQVEWLDKTITSIEGLVAQLATSLSASWKAWRAGGTGGAGPVRGLRERTTDWARRFRAWHGSNRRWVPAALAIVLTPPLLAQIVVANRRSMERALQVVTPAPIEVVNAFRRSDEYRIAAASKPAPSTRGLYKTLGLAAALPSAQASHLDLWAAGEDYLKLHEFPGAAPPFAYVQSGKIEKRGQLGIIARFLDESSPSLASAFAALGFTTLTAEGLADLTGKPQSNAARQLFSVYQEAGAGGELSDLFDIAGCRTIRTALDKQLAWKRLAVDEVKLADRHYLLDLAVPTVEACPTGTQAALKAASSLAEFQRIGYLREVTPTDDGDKEITYQVVVPKVVAAELRGNDDLSLYVAGLRAFYLLDFSDARSRFEALSRSPRPVAATLGAFLTARVIFWQHDFERGSYRPDLFAPWRRLAGDDDDGSASKALEKVNAAAQELKDEGELVDCSSQRSAKPCRWTTVRQRATETYDPLPAPATLQIARILKQVEGNPIIKPELVREYLASGSPEPADAIDDGGEP